MSLATWRDPWPRLWGHSPLTPPTAHAPEGFTSFPSVPEELASQECPGSHVRRAGWAAQTSLLRVDSAQTPSSPTGYTHCRAHRQKHEMTKSWAALTTLPVQTCHRHTHSPKAVSAHAPLTHPQTLAAIPVTSHWHPVAAAWPPSLTVSPSTGTRSGTTFSGLQVHWGGWNQAGTASPYWVP